MLSAYAIHGGALRLVSNAISLVAAASSLVASRASALEAQPRFAATPASGPSDQPLVEATGERLRRGRTSGPGRRGAAPPVAGAGGRGPAGTTALPAAGHAGAWAWLLTNPVSGRKTAARPLGVLEVKEATACVLVGMAIACACLLPWLVYVRANSQQTFSQLEDELARQHGRAKGHRELLARVLGGLNSARQAHLAALISILGSDPDEGVASAAAGVLSEPEVLAALHAPHVAPAPGEAGPSLGSARLEALRDADREVRLAAVLVLGGLVDAESPRQPGAAGGTGSSEGAGSQGVGESPRRRPAA